MADLRTTIGTLQLRNPVMSASGTYGHGLESQFLASPSSVGALVSKTVTLKPRHGNPVPRICETEAGVLNSIGLENKGVAYYVDHILPDVREADTLIVANIGAESIEDFVEMARLLAGREEIDAFEVNLSCPNVQDGKLPFATDPRTASRVIEGVKRATTKPVWAKLSPNVTRIGDMARAVEEAGADAVTAVNTVLGMKVDWRTGKPGLATVQGGYSGVAIKPIALRCAWECARSVSIPVVGCGGIMTAEDALEFLVVGCRAVQLGTVNFSDPGLVGRVAGEMSSLLDKHGVARAADLVGTLRLPDALKPAARPEAPAASGAACAPKGA